MGVRVLPYDNSLFARGAAYGESYESSNTKCWTTEQLALEKHGRRAWV
jgi:hypothetical protein